MKKNCLASDEIVKNQGLFIELAKKNAFNSNSSIQRISPNNFLLVFRFIQKFIKNIKEKSRVQLYNLL